jgi:poly(3-hydroxybutyrate) depolymerase
MFNGALDQHVPLKGGMQALHAEEQARYVSSAQQSAQFWVKANGCQPDPKVEEFPQQKATRYTWSGGREHTRVVLWVLHNQGHAWPGGAAPRAGSDQPTPLVKAHEVLWQFFKDGEREP